MKTYIIVLEATSLTLNNFTIICISLHKTWLWVNSGHIYLSYLLLQCLYDVPFLMYSLIVMDGPKWVSSLNQKVHHCCSLPFAHPSTWIQSDTLMLLEWLRSQSQTLSLLRAPCLPTSRFCTLLKLTVACQKLLKKGREAFMSPSLTGGAEKVIKGDNDVLWIPHYVDHLTTNNNKDLI